MNILFEIGHPAHVHFFKNVIWNLENSGHRVLIAAKDKEVALNLLNSYRLKYTITGSNYKNLLKKSYGLIKTDYKLLKTARMFKPDILVGRGSPYLAHLSLLIRKPYIAFVDTEHAHLVKVLSHPFASAICVPSCYQGSIDPKKEIRFNGYKELAYLHPNYFTPDPSVLEDIGLSRGDKFIILRFVSWSASHDINDRGFSDKKQIVKTLRKYCKVFITSEYKLSEELEKYRITVPPEKIHHLMCYANLFIGESATMATESVILGTPAIFVSTSRRGYTDELESKYDMLYTFSNPHDAQEKSLEKAIELIGDEDTKRKWSKKRTKLLEDKIDVTEFMTEFIENYPESFHASKGKFDVQQNRGFSTSDENNIT